MNTTGKVLWKANSGHHDWSDGVLFRCLMAHAQSLGLIGPIKWMQCGEADERVPVSLPAGADLPDQLLALAEPDEGIIALSAGGDDPAPWEVFWKVYPFKPKNGLMGINTYWLTFDRSLVPDRSKSDHLLQAFQAAHTSANTEYAMIHPYAHWNDLTDGPYEVPVTIAPMFRGVYWANFLGGRQIEEFEYKRLIDLHLKRVHWQGRTGLIFITAPELAVADSLSVEVEMVHLNQNFRRALKADSPWRKYSKK